ncbi:hypothetical protein F5Y04DRAFT_286909 [Hypomontagnella monticulosa]|nr:hypothetical protein F5Y04DRAFT_286909 [Hypomontagnella monticulosa]
MPLEQQNLRVDGLPAIPSSMDPISSCPIAPQLLTSARVAAVLSDRTRSLNVGGNTTLENDQATGLGTGGRRGRSATPIRANVKRKRSVASAPGDALLDRPSIGDALLTPNTSESVQNQNEVRLSSFAEGAKAPDEGDISAERRVRRGIPPGDTEPPKRKKVDGKHNTSDKSTAEENRSIKKLLGVTKETERPGRPAAALLPLSLEVESHDNDGKAVYEQKGAFRLKKNEGNRQFRFPKSLSQPEPLWRAGDGFSVDEARPGFVFLMTGAHGRGRSRSVPGIGKLPLESENVSGENLRALGTTCPKVQRLSQYDTKRRRGAAKDVWPTRDNFSEEIPSRKRDPTILENQKVIPSTIPPPSLFVPASRAKETFDYKPPAAKTRQHSDFENFGKRLRDGSTLCPTSVQGPHLQYVGESEPAVDGEYEGDEGEPVDDITRNEALEEDEEYAATNEEHVSISSGSQASSTGDSASYVIGGEDSELLEVEKVGHVQKEREFGEQVLISDR